MAVSLSNNDVYVEYPVNNSWSVLLSVRRISDGHDVSMCVVMILGDSVTLMVFLLCWYLFQEISR